MSMEKVDFPGSFLGSDVVAVSMRIYPFIKKIDPKVAEKFGLVRFTWPVNSESLDLLANWLYERLPQDGNPQVSKINSIIDEAFERRAKYKAWQEYARSTFRGST